jgi:ornithine carbamoyltransferase
MAETKLILKEMQATGVSASSSSRREKPTLVKHLLSLSDLRAKDLAHLVDQSVIFASDRRNVRKSLTGKTVGVYFRKPSTRTRSSFIVGAIKLGAQVVTYGPDDLQLVTGETIEDTARALSGYLDALIIRTNSEITEMRAMADQNEMAVINAMSENEHPTQAIADLSTIKEHFGRLEGIHVLYLGDGNNTAAALALAAAQTPGMRMTFVTPKGYGVPEPLIEHARRLAGLCGATIEHHHSVDKLPKAVDAVYTTRWRTMGIPHADPNWIDNFWPYSVTQAVMAKVSKPSGTIFLHDLPAVRGEDVCEDVLNGPQSLVWRQASHKMWGAMAVLEWCLKRGV